MGTQLDATMRDVLATFPLVGEREWHFLGHHGGEADRRRLRTPLHWNEIWARGGCKINCGGLLEE